MDQKVLNELKYVDENLEFSKRSSPELRQKLLDNGLVEYYENVLMLTNLGELQAGYTKEQIGMEDDEYQDITEAFFYMDDEDGGYF